MDDREQRTRSILMMAVCAMMWSIAGIFIKYIPWNPIVIAGGRSAVGMIIIFCYMRKTGMRIRINRASVFAGLTLAVTFTAFVSANKLTTAANAIVLQYTAPLFVVLISSLMFKQRFRREDYAVVAVTIFGIAFCFGGQLSGGGLFGNIIAVLSGLCYAAMIVLTGRTDRDSRMSGILLGQVFMAVVGVPFFFLYPPVPEARPVLFLLILGVVQLGIPYILFGLAAEHSPPLARCLIGVLEPLLNPLWVFLFYHEAPGASSLIGGAIVIATVTLWTIRNSRVGSGS